MIEMVGVTIEFDSFSVPSRFVSMEAATAWITETLAVLLAEHGITQASRIMIRRV